MTFKLIAREGVEPSFPPYQSSVLNRWTTGLGCLLSLKVRVIGFEPTISWSQTTRVAKLPHTRMCSVRTVGFEPTISWPPTRRDARLRHVLR